MTKYLDKSIEENDTTLDIDAQTLSNGLMQIQLEIGKDPWEKLMSCETIKIYILR